MTPPMPERNPEASAEAPAVFPVSDDYLYSTADLPPGTGLDAQMAWWEETIGARFPLLLDHSRTEGTRMESRGWGRRFGDIFGAEVECSPHLVRRTRETIARRPLDSLLILRQVGAHGSALEARGGRAGGPLRAHDLFVGSTDEPFESLTKKGFRHDVWIVPASKLKASASLARLEAGAVLTAEQPEAAILSAFLSGLKEFGRDMDAPTAAGFAENLPRLLEIAAGELPQDVEGGVDALRNALVQRAKLEVERTLGDPLLSPARIAARCGVSVRKLHASFESAGTSIGRYILLRRLERARAQLVEPLSSSRSIAEIAFSLGFNSLATFYRNYGERYGEAPGETRAQDARG